MTQSLCGLQCRNTCLKKSQKYNSKMTAFWMMNAFPRSQTSKLLPPRGILYNYKSWIPSLRHETWGQTAQTKKTSSNGTSVSDMLHDRHLSGRRRTDGYTILLLQQDEDPSGVNELQTPERSPGSSTSFLLLIFKSSFPIQSLIFPVQNRKQHKKPTRRREAKS